VESKSVLRSLNLPHEGYALIITVGLATRWSIAESTVATVNTRAKMYMDSVLAVTAIVGARLFW
jgi:prolipoprotein diacylglyceryltransferase